MKSETRAFTSVVLMSGIALVCCSCSRKRDPEALAELQQMSSAVQDVGIVVSAGVTREQYSQRLTDALLKFGNSDAGCKQAIAKFAEPDQKARAGEICQHLTEAMDAYTYAKEYLGPAYDDDLVIDTLGEKSYAEARKRFPALEELPVSETNDAGYKFYSRDAMVQALWRVAGQDAQTAKDLLEKLAQT